MITRLVSRRTAFLTLGLAALLALALGLWLGVFEAERASAHPLDLSVTVSSSPASGTVMAAGSVVTYTVTVTSDGATTAPGGTFPLSIDLSSLTLVTTSIQGTGITCTATDPLACEVTDFTVGGSKNVVFSATVGAVGPALVGAALDPPIDSVGVGEIDEGTATPDAALDDGDDESLTCATVGEGSDPENTEPDNFDCTSHTVGTADLTISKTANPTEAAGVLTAGTITYTITVSNSAGNATATNIPVRDMFETPSEVSLTNVAATFPDTCTDVSLPDINCTIASLAPAGQPGSSRTITVVAQVTAAGGNTILEGAYVDPANVITETNDDADEPLAVPDCTSVGEGAAGPAEPDNFDCTAHAVSAGTVNLTISKTASPAEGTVATGAAITYTLTATNSGTAAASGVVIRDTLGTGLTLTSVTEGTGVTCGDKTAPEINCTADIPAGGSRTVTVATTVAATSGTVLNGAYVDPPPPVGGAISETNEDADDPALDCAAVGEGSDAAPDDDPDNFDCTSHTVGAGLNLTVTKTASPSDGSSVATGGAITYTVTVSATGATASSVAIRDTIGTGLSLTSVTPGTGVTCADTTAPEINCTAATIAAGSSVTVTVATTVSATSGTVLNGARVDPGSAITEANEDADDPSLDCTAVGEGTDAGDATEPDNFDCTSHTVAAAATRTLNLSPAGWHNFVWTGASATAPETALACISGKFSIAYEHTSLGTFQRFVAGHPELSNMSPLTQYDPLLVFITAEGVTCVMPVAS